MQNNNQPRENPEKETVKEQNNPLLGRFTDEVGMSTTQDSPMDGDERDEEDNELGDDDIGNDDFEEEDNRSEKINLQQALDNNEDERPDSTDADENYPGLKENDLDQSEQPEEPDQPDVRPEGKEIANDASIRDLYDTNPNASTVRSSNAARTFGDEKQHPDGDKGDPDRMEGENES